MKKLSFVLFLSLLGLGCSDDEALTPTEAVEQYCSAIDAHDLRCGDDVDEFCREDINGCLFAEIRSELHGPIQSCIRDRQCNESDDACFADDGPVIRANPAGPRAAALSTRCMARYTECDAQESRFSDDYCFSAAVFGDPALGAIEHCLGLGCGEIEDCLETLNGICPEER